ncbi:GNAT family N-acetyltransferase [Paenibacillus sp. sptzw28]|uniref:GNAT family N-acetyltransferase n=1 Tax=Paenibacillus sp. sptzw28 TaxID=715179 RepID=UPI001C6ECBA7|nr:GNAT family N-acetyltransferase [Paenibacillus sp. sptzw28]QYR21609.1 GNAT family N-acetyltransferase [Paenibacillus sp. sptzw28]
MNVPRSPHTNRYFITPLSAKLAEELCSWRYEPPFDFYNWSSWEVMLQLGLEFGDSEIRNRQYAAVVDSDGSFIGFAQFFPLLGVTRIGLGMRPDLCGQGFGLRFVQTIVLEAIRRAPQDVIDLEVHVWNLRAIRTYEKAGFVITDTYTRRTANGPVDVHCMTYAPKPMDAS